MLDSGESRKEVIRPDFSRAIMIDFRGAKITSDVGFLLMREIDDRFKIIAPRRYCLDDLRSAAHTKHSLVEMIRQRACQIAASYEDCNDADFLRIDPALRLALGKDHQAGAGQSRLSRLENDILGNEAGPQALEAALTRSTDTPLKRQNKKRLIGRYDHNGQALGCNPGGQPPDPRGLSLWGPEKRSKMGKGKRSASPSSPDSPPALGSLPSVALSSGETSPG